MKIVSIIILTFLIVCMTSFFSVENLSASTAEEILEEIRLEEELMREEGYEPFDQEESGEQQLDEEMPEEEYQQVEEEQYVPDHEDERL
jgi:hypothetical protein